MFTGIIEAIGDVLQKTDDSLVVTRPMLFDDMKKGSSVAVSGACLTIVALDAKTMTFNVVEETWAKTKLGELTMGDRVNLERALRADGRLDGHMVQGHVEGVGVVSHQSPTPQIKLPVELLKFIVPKGSITLDGVSLTVASIDGDIISVALIPETLQVTTLGTLTPGDQVNIETDILGRYVHSLLRRVP